MDKISQNDLTGLHAWMLFIVNRREAHLTEQDVSLNVFGSDDDSYLVVNVYQSDSEADQFVLQSDAPNVSLPLIIDFLGDIDFDVSQLISFLLELDFSQSKQITTSNGLTIFYNHDTSN